MAVVEDGVPISAGDLMHAVGASVRLETGLPGFDYILNGGLPRFGGAILLCAPSGCGKTSFIFKLFRTLAKLKIDSLFISSEQPLLKLGEQFSWMGTFPSKHMVLHYATKKDDIISSIEKSSAKVFAVDSITEVQDIVDPSGYELAAGQPTAVKQVGRELSAVAADREALVFCVGHVNADGTLKGGTGIRHLLDATLVMRQWPGLTARQQEKDKRRILQFEGKTRFGPRGRRALYMLRDDDLTDEGPLAEDPDEDAGEEVEDLT